MKRLGLAALIATLASPALAETQSDSKTPPITLAEVEQLALANNPTSAAAGAAVDAARARMRQAGSWPNPVVGYSGEELKGGRSDRRGEHGFFVEQTIPLGGKRRLAQDVGLKAVAQAEAVGELQRLRILGSVRRLYYTVLLAGRRIEVQERLAALVSEAVGVTAQLFNVGAADRPDYLEIEVESRRMQLELARTRNDLFALRQQLAALAGARDLLTRPLAGTVDEGIPELERDRVLQAVQQQSPALRAARLELERARAVTSRARRAAYPDLFLRGGGAYNRELGEDSGRPIGWEGTFEAGISVPLFNRNTWGIAAARAEETRAQAEVTRLELSLESRAVSEFARYLTALRASETYRGEILPRAEEAYRLYVARYQEMAAAYPQVLVAQRTLLELSDEYLDNLNDTWDAALRLQAFLAGEALEPPMMMSGPEGEGTGGER